MTTLAEVNASLGVTNIALSDVAKEQKETNKGISKFVEGMPTMKHEEKFTCKKCKHENTVELKGLQDFF